MIVIKVLVQHCIERDVAVQMQPNLVWWHFRKYGRHFWKNEKKKKPLLYCTKLTAIALMVLHATERQFHFHKHMCCSQVLSIKAATTVECHFFQLWWSLPCQNTHFLWSCFMKTTATVWLHFGNYFRDHWLHKLSGEWSLHLRPFWGCKHITAQDWRY